MQAKRIRALALSLWFALSVVVPVKRANAAFPLVALAVAAYNSAGALVTADLLAAGGTALIGGTIAALAITPNNADAPMRVPLMSDKPTIDAVMPPPANPGTVPASTSYTYCGGNPVSVCFQNDLESCNRNGASGSPQYNCTGSVSCSGGGANCTGSINMAGGFTYSYTVGYSGTPTQTCPAGSVSSGSQCVVTNPREAVPDNKKDIQRSASGFSAAGDADPLPSYAQVQNGVVYASGKNSSGNPVMIEYSVSADGSKTYVRHYVQSEDSAQSTVKAQTLVVDNATGTIQSASAATTAGAVTPATGAGSIPSVATGAAVTAGAGSQPIVFPTDYARAGEAALAASSVTAKLDTVKTSVESLKEAPAVENPDISTPTLSGAQDTFYGNDNKIIGLLGWHVPGFTGICPTADINFDWKDFSYHGRFESHCAYADQFRATAATIFDALWVIVAFFIVLGA